MSEERILAPAFRQRGLRNLFAALVASVVYIATLAITAEGALTGIILSWDQGMQNRLTVEIPAVDDESSVSQEERVRQALTILRGDPAVASAEKINDDEVARLLKPWINDAELLKKLPVPALIAVAKKPGGALAAAALEDRLKHSIADARVDDHGAWLADFSRFIRTLAVLAGLLVVLTALTLILAVALLCRTVMAAEKDTISLLHVMGADDEAIARHFGHHARQLSWPAALAGFFFAAATLGAMAFFLKEAVDPAALPAAQWVGMALLALLIPFAATLAAGNTARRAALGLLRAS